jgi:hypothetical protein
MAPRMAEMQNSPDPTSRPMIGAVILGRQDKAPVPGPDLLKAVAQAKRRWGSRIPFQSRDPDLADQRGRMDPASGSDQAQVPCGVRLDKHGTTASS